MYLVSTRARSARLLLILSLLALAALLLVLAVPPAQALTLATSPPLAGALHVSPALALAALGTSAIQVDASPFVLPRSMQGKALQPWFQTLLWAPINAAAVTPVPTIANPNFDVVVHRIAYMARDAVTLAPVDRPLLLADLTLASNWSFNPAQSLVELENLAGVNRGTTDLWVPISIPAGEVLTVQLTNASAVNLRVSLALIGLRAALAAR